MNRTFEMLRGLQKIEVKLMKERKEKKKKKEM